jgi:hypothetical protein
VLITAKVPNTSIVAPIQRHANKAPPAIIIVASAETQSTVGK